MKRKVASRKLKRRCIYCEKSFIKGEVYYLKRTVFSEFGEVFADEYLVCPKCKLKEERHSERFKEFQKRCTHPEKFQDTVYDYWSPLYDICLLCGHRY